MIIELKRVLTLIFRLFCKGKMEEEEEERIREDGERDGVLFIRYIRYIRNLGGSLSQERRRDIKLHAADSL